MKKQFVKALVLILALVLCLSLPLSVSAATTADATIDPNAMCSLSIYKYDFTNALKDGVWTADSFTSTGVYES